MLRHDPFNLLWQIPGRDNPPADLPARGANAIGGAASRVDRPDAFLPTYAALFKLASFDMSVALGTYIQAGSQRLGRLRNYLEQIISSMPSGVMVVDGDGALRTVNQAMLAMLGEDGGPAPEV
nr:PAS domain-containing protein [uncultured Duganella sp.]